MLLNFTSLSPSPTLLVLPSLTGLSPHAAQHYPYQRLFGGFHCVGEDFQNSLKPISHCQLCKIEVAIFFIENI